MHITLVRLARSHGGAAIVAMLMAVVAPGAEAQTSSACYVPGTGVVYRIKQPGLPQACRAQTHIEFAWDALADGGVTTIKLADGAVVTVKIADGAITATKIASAAVGSTQLADAAVTSAKLAAGAVGTTQIADASVTAAKLSGVDFLPDGAVTTVKIADNAVTTAKIAPGSVGTVQMANASILAIKLANGSVTAPAIAAGAVGTAQIAANAVTSAQIAPGAVGSTQILDGSVSTAEIATGSVTRAKLAGDVFLPIAYGMMQPTGSPTSGCTITSRTPNITSCTYDATNGWFLIAISGENYNFSTYVTVVTQVCCVGVFESTSSVGGNLLVAFRNASQQVSNPQFFQFVVFKP